MDRIDIHLDVMRAPFEKLSSLEGGESFLIISARVEAARAVQAICFAPLDAHLMITFFYEEN